MIEPFLRGQMMEEPLLVSSMLKHAQRSHGTTEIVTRLPDGTLGRSSWDCVARRAAQAAHALTTVGLGMSERAGTLAWNTTRHLELYYAIPSMGSVLHTINPRLFEEQLLYIIQDADDRIIFFDPHLLPLVATLAPKLPRVRRWIMLCDAAQLAFEAATAGAAADAAAVAAVPGLQDYESFLSGHPDQFVWPDLPEESAAALCYTSGTTGNPKGVLYSHRSTLLHTLVTIAPDVLNLSARDTVLPVVPMFHVNAWGLPFSCAVTGARLVLPGRQLDGDSLFDLLDGEGVTLSVGVPTVWLALLETLRARGRKPARLERLMVGGSACPPALSDAFTEEFGIEVLHGWGLTETSPVAALASPRNTTTPEVAATLRYRQGRPLFGIELEIVGPADEVLPHDGKTSGNLMVRGHWVASSYFPAERNGSALHNGWFPTGDIANIDAEGFVQITDRSKDVIKSGGEWISSIDLENAALAHPGVAQAAAIGIPHPKWDERPLLLVIPRAGAEISKESILEVLAARVAKWWLPNDVIFVQSLPMTATGKLSKLALRREYREFRFPDA